VANYLSKVASLAMYSFSIWLTVTLEYVFNIQFWIPIAHNLRMLSNTASYSTMLLLLLSVSVVNCKHTTYLSLMPEGDIRIAAALVPETP
jgi:hypothetical protein